MDSNRKTVIAVPKFRNWAFTDSFTDTPDNLVTLTSKERKGYQIKWMGYASCAHACKRTRAHACKSVFQGTFIIRTFHNSVNVFSFTIIFVIVCALSTADRHLHRDPAKKRPGSCFTKVPCTFRARKASCQPTIRLFSKSDSLTCFQWKKTQEDCEVWWVRTVALRRWRRNCGTRNRPEKFRDIWQRIPQGAFPESPRNLTGPRTNWIQG